MQKFIAYCLVVTTAVGVESRPAHASGRREPKRVAALKVQFSELPPGSETDVELTDRGTVAGEYAAVGEDVPDRNPPASTNAMMAETKSTANDPALQSSPGGQQRSGASSSHHVRNAILIFAVGFAFILIVAIATKK